MKNIKVRIPEEYEIREARINDAEEVALVHFMTWKTNYKGIIKQSYLDNISLKERLILRQKVIKESKGVHLVATFRGKVVAFYDAAQFRFHKNQKVSEQQLKHRKEKGEIYAIYVLQEHQHIGLGKAMFEVGRNKLKERRLIPFIAWVLKDNHQAIQFYEKMSGKSVDELVVTIGEEQYLEVAYRFE